MTKAAKRAWPLWLHLLCILWVCYALALFLTVPEGWTFLVQHIILLGVPPWMLGREMQKGKTQ